MVENTNNSLTNQRRSGVWIGVAIFVVALGLLIAFIHGVHLVNPNSIEAAINQNLGPESDLPSVRQFMDAHHIVYAGYSEVLQRAYGKVYRSSVGLRTGYIYIEFNFDEHGKLASHRVVELFHFLW